MTMEKWQLPQSNTKDEEPSSRDIPMPLWQRKTHFIVPSVESSLVLPTPEQVSDAEVIETMLSQKEVSSSKKD